MASPRLHHRKGVLLTIRDNVSISSSVVDDNDVAVVAGDTVKTPNLVLVADPLAFGVGAESSSTNEWRTCKCPAKWALRFSKWETSLQSYDRWIVSSTA